MLFVIATPIGNLEDISLRALATLKDVDLILAEDTRRIKILLQKYQIQNRVDSFHLGTERAKESFVIDKLRSGLTIALVSDAGTPCLADPGFLLVKRCHEEGIPVRTIPGPSAITAAAVLAGLPGHPFQFLGFMPKKSGERDKILKQAWHYQGSSIIFDTPHQIEQSLQAMHDTKPHHKVYLFREITKAFEEHLIDFPEHLLSHFKEHPPRGEFVVVIPKIDKLPPPPSLSDIETYHLLKDANLGETLASSLTAKIFGTKKREYYGYDDRHSNSP